MTLQLDIPLYMNRTFERRLAVAVERAAADQCPYAVVACVLQRLPGERIPDVARVVTDCVSGLVRDGDVAELLGGEIVAVGLPDTAARAAGVIAHRLQSDLRLRSAHINNTVWDTGFACLPEDGLTAEELLDAAVEAARTRRRRLGA